MRDIVLIGPMGAGKSTIGGLLSGSVNKRFLDLDSFASQLKADYYIGRQEADRLNNEFGVMAWYKYQKPFEFLVAMKAIKSHQNSVIAFGGGHSVYDDVTMRSILKDSLSNHHVVLLLESENRQETVDACFSRKRGNIPRELNEYFIDHISNSELANHTVYTRRRPPESVRDEILSRLAIAEETSENV
jgi:shikimate kinase